MQKASRRCDATGRGQDCCQEQGGHCERPHPCRSSSRLPSSPQWVMASVTTDKPMIYGGTEEPCAFGCESTTPGGSNGYCDACFVGPSHRATAPPATPVWDLRMCTPALLPADLMSIGSIGGDKNKKVRPAQRYKHGHRWQGLPPHTVSNDRQRTHAHTTTRPTN
mgnify:CR=1 FL=1